MSSVPENAPAQDAAGRQALRRRSGRGRTFRPRHRLSKPKINPEESQAGVDAVAVTSQPGMDARPEEEARPQPGDTESPESQATHPMDVAEQVGPSEEPEEPSSQATEESDQPPRLTPSDESREPERPEPSAARPSPQPDLPPLLPGKIEALAYRPASPRSIEQAVLEVKRIVDTLQQALQDMEEVLELIEDAEQHKVADEREILRLQEVLRQITQPRERPPTPPPAERRRRESPDSGPGTQPSHPPAPSGQGGPGNSEERQSGRRRRRGRGRGRGRGPEGSSGSGTPSAHPMTDEGSGSESRPDSESEAASGFARHEQEREESRPEEREFRSDEGGGPPPPEAQESHGPENRDPES